MKGPCMCGDTECSSCGPPQRSSEPIRFQDIVAEARSIIACARADGLTIDGSNVVDLLADNITDLPLFQLEAAAQACGIITKTSQRLRKDDVCQIIELLQAAFVWDETPQRIDYWSQVVRNLKELLE